jgi:hypothetical protein
VSLKVVHKKRYRTVPYSIVQYLETFVRVDSPEFVSILAFTRNAPHSNSLEFGTLYAKHSVYR